jgi:hypothetical protein
VLIFAAGVFRDRDEGGVVGIHRPTFEPNYFAGLSVETARAKYFQMAQKVRIYLSEMGMSDRLFEQMMNVASNEIRILSLREMTDLGLSGYEPAYEERQRAEGIVRFGADYLRRIDEYAQGMRRYIERCMMSGSGLHYGAQTPGFFPKERNAPVARF